MDGHFPYDAPRTTPKVAWVCNWLDPSLPEEAARLLNFCDTTVAFLMRQDPAARVEKLIGLVRHNAAALTNQVNLTAALPPPRRAMRLATHFLPCYSHPAVRPIYDDPALRAVVEEVTAPIGPRIREAGIRISTHPGQYCVLATESDAVRRSSIEEIEYHVHVMRLLGHVGGWHPHGAHVNVHGGGRPAGIEGFRASFAMLSEDARGLLTVENDEIAYGLDDLLPLTDALPIVLDIHHHWVMTGEYVAPDDPRIARVIGSWRGTRPVAHVSSPREAISEDMDPDTLPDRAALVEAGANIRDLRMHSDRLWNRAHAAWAAGHLAWADIEVEAKDKNLATQDFAVAAGLVEFVEPPPAYVKLVRMRKAETSKEAPDERAAAAKGPKVRAARGPAGEAAPAASPASAKGRAKAKAADVSPGTTAVPAPPRRMRAPAQAKVGASPDEAAAPAAPGRKREAKPSAAPASLSAESGRKRAAKPPTQGGALADPSPTAAAAESIAIPKPPPRGRKAAGGAGTASASHTLIIPKALPDTTEAAPRRGRPRSIPAADG